MSTNIFRKLKRRIQDLPKERLAREVLEDFTDEIADAQREQMMEGKRKDGSKIGEYSEGYKQLKKEWGQPFDRVTLKKEGDFHEGIFAKIEGARRPSVKLFSTDFKAEMLTKRYGNDIWGLTPQKAEQINRDGLLEAMRQKVKDYYNGK